ncbi:MAG: ParB/RepB/Spo0J family partition protein [Eubacteriales bacterium]|nr:ParB/RepB/Spo0J family partition protein [Eubacteriales bacterium]
MNKQITYIPIDKIHPHPDNPRKDLGDLTELTESIRTRGILQNLTVVPQNDRNNFEDREGYYATVIGHRRLAAAKLAGLTEVPCVVSDMDHKEQVATMLLENIQRSDLTPIEQAQGFQIMIDLGEAVAGIAEKTGFSDRTIQKRLNLVKLDQKKLQESYARGGTLMDYAKLEQIKSEKQKNHLLQYIGTKEFEWNLKRALDEQQKPERKKALLAELDAFAKKIDEKETSKLQYVNGFYGFEKQNWWKMPTDTGKVEYFYTAANDKATLYKMPEKEAPKKPSAKEKAFNERESKLKKLSKQAYELRYDFVKNFSAGKKYAKEIQDFAVLRLLEYHYPNPDSIFKAFAVDKSKTKDLDYSQVHEYKKSLVLSEYGKAPEKTLFLLAYAGCDDKPSNDYFQARSWESKIAHEENSALNVLYDALISLGYEMSEEEQQLRDGTHELFDKPEKPVKEEPK